MLLFATQAAHEPPSLFNTHLFASLLQCWPPRLKVRCTRSGSFEMRADIDDGVTIMQRFCTILCLDATSQFRNKAGGWLNRNNRLVCTNIPGGRSYPPYPGIPMRERSKDHIAATLSLGRADRSGPGPRENREISRNILYSPRGSPQLAPGAGGGCSGSSTTDLGRDGSRASITPRQSLSILLTGLEF